jgi:hypothetical protein
MIEIYSLNTEVFVDGEIPAVIRGVTIYSETWVKYLCVWWDERNRREEWLAPSEFTVRESRKSEVKFV